eukprot:PITA_02072
MLIARKSMEEINRLKAQLSRAFDMKDLGVTRHILGMEIHRDKKNGSLMYVMVSTRLNISYAVGVVSRFMANRGDLDKRRFTTGYVFTLAGGEISWMSKLQEIVVLSATEAEYIAASDASKEANLLKGLLDEIGIMQEKVNVLCDSQSVIHLATNPTYHSRTMNNDVMYHF